MEKVKTPSSDYYGLKRLIEIGAMASPLVVVFAVFLAPLFAESIALVIYYDNALVVLGVMGLLVASIAIIFAGLQCYYYINRRKNQRLILYALGSVLLVTTVIAIIVNACAIDGSYDMVRYFTTLLQSFIAIIIFTIFNIVFMYAWTKHLDTASVTRVSDEDINKS